MTNAVLKPLGHFAADGLHSQRISSRRIVVLWLAFFWILAVGITPLHAQTYLENIGVPTFSTQVPIENGFIDGSNGNLHLEIPLGSFPQRAGGTEKVSFMYDSAIWFNNAGVWSPTNVGSYVGNNVYSGWRLASSGDTGTITSGELYSGWCNQEDDYALVQYTPWIWTAPDGTIHSFPASTKQQLYPGICGGLQNSTSNAYASDGTGFYMSITNYTSAIVYAPDGTAVGGVHTDPNGNYYSTSYVTSPYDLKLFDTLNRKVVEVTGSTGGPYTYAVSNDQGSTSSYTVKLQTINVDTSFGQSGVAEYSGTMQVVSEIDLPDGSKYTFTYDSGTTAGHYGLPTSMTLPTGSQISYSWSLRKDATGQPYMWINSRTTPNGAWNYGFSVINTCGTGQVNCEQQFTVTKPSQDQAVYTLAVNAGSWPIQEQFYNGPASPSNLLVSTTQCFSFVTMTNGACSYSVTTASPATSVHLSGATSTLPTPSGSLSKTVEYSWDTNNYGNVTQISEWNFGSSLTSSADRTTAVSYYAPSNNIHNVVNRPTVIKITDKNNNVVSQTTNTYDGSSPSAKTGIVNHDDTDYPASFNVRGNLTTVQRLVTGSTSASKTMTYDATGQVLSATDWNGNSTTFSYTDNFFNDNGGTSPPTYTPAAPTNAYMTQATFPGSLTMNYGYFWGSGQIALTTDFNLNKTHHNFYDPFDRPTLTTFPNSGWTEFQYSSTFTQMNTYTGITTSTPATNCTGSSGGCRADQTVFDGMGRVISQILASDPDSSSGQTTVATTYDPNGRAQTVTNPYRSTSDSTYGIQSFYYDGLDRKTGISQPDGQIVQTLYGANVTAGGGIPAQVASPATYGYGYPILYVDEAGKMRQVWVDGLGRTIETDEPTASMTAKAANGSASVAGSEENSSVGTVTIGGTERSKVIRCACGNYTIYDYGTVSITVNGTVASVSYDQGSTSASVAAALAVAINGNSNYFATATASGSIVNLTAKPKVGATNYSLSAQAITSDPTDFPSGSFTTTPSGSALSGTIYDSGTAWIAVNDFIASYAYGQSDTPTTIATGLKNSANQSDSPVTATIAGTTLTLTAKGTDSNFTFASGTFTNQPTIFSPISFSVTAADNDLNNGLGSATIGTMPSVAATASGVERTAGTASVSIGGTERSKVIHCGCGNYTIYDYGTVSITVAGTVASVSYDQGSTSASIASALATAINGNSSYPATATASGSVVNMTARVNYGQALPSLSAQATTSDPSDFPSGSFTTTPSGSQFANPVNDTGTVSVTVNDFTKSVSYGSTDTPTTIATNLATAFNNDGNSPVSASSSSGVVTISGKGTGYYYQLSSSQATSQLGTFPASSFTITLSSLELSNSTGGGSSATSAASTFYTYDLNNNLRGVVSAGGQQNICNSTFSRCYSYDMLSRLTSRTEPETGTTTFSYTTSGGALCSGDLGAICQRTAPLENQTGTSTMTTTYSYDTLNRPTQRSYSDGAATVTYSYDQTTGANGFSITNGKGRRTGMTDASGQTNWSYNAIGNVVAEQRTIAGVTKTITYNYNYDRSLNYVVYPSGRKVTYAVSNAQRQTSALDTSNGINYAKNATYAPPGGLATAVYGAAGSFSGMSVADYYNVRLQPCRISIRSTGNGPGSCQDSTHADLLDLAFSFPSLNNGNISSQSNNVNTGRSQSYTNDYLNRILTAQSQATSGGDCWGQSFTIDQLANLLSASSIQCSSPAPSYGVNTHNEATTGYSYDAPGNVTADTQNSYKYDAESHVVTATISSTVYCYLYDGDGVRVEKAQPVSGGTCTTTGSLAPAAYQLYWRDTSGNSLAETDGTGSTSNANYHEYVSFDGQRVARSDPSSGYAYYYLTDHLGSTRVVEQEQLSNGAISAAFTQEYFPYGQEVYSQSFDPRYKFTGYERDSETGLDYAFARYYNSRLGRFMSGDPLPGNTNDPQSLNRYAYARNNPSNLTDPTGACFGEDDPTWDLMFGTTSGGGEGGGGVGFNVDGTFSFGSHSSCDWDDRQPPVYDPPQVGKPMNPFSGILGTIFGTVTGGQSLPTPVQPTFPSDPISDMTAMLNSIYSPIDPTRFMSVDSYDYPAVFAGAFQALFPTEIPGLGVGFSVPFAFDLNGFSCYGFGVAAGTVGHSLNFGELTGGDLWNYKNILEGHSSSFDYQYAPWAGAQTIWNSSGTLRGTTFGTEGVSWSWTDSTCSVVH
jgi:RHS repeat-associated protein